ncbi:MAG: heme-binding protein [Bacteroidetes bacterium]|nr:MAG: heme-binding protein [Bacteroidota bacterium]
MTTQKGQGQTEHQPYTPVQQFPGFEVRYYPEAILASVYSSAKSYRELTSPGFNTLAGYIFGGNDAGKKIAMTAPVHMDIHESGSRMSFVIPSGYEMEDLPIPDNAAVKIERSQPGYVAAITFGGYASDEKILEEGEKLRKYLKQNNIQWEGNFRFLGYNSPYKFWNRRNEVVVNIIWE